MIYTIGYQAITPAKLKKIAEKLDATVIDVRARPRSRKPGFGREALARVLGPRYLWKGDELGGPGGGGKVTAEGIAALRRLRRRSSLILLCLEHAPGDCHRHHDICAPHFPKAIHICDDEMIRAHELARAIADDDEYEIEGSLADWMAG